MDPCLPAIIISRIELNSVPMDSASINLGYRVSCDARLREQLQRMKVRNTSALRALSKATQACAICSVSFRIGGPKCYRSRAEAGGNEWGLVSNSPVSPGCGMLFSAVFCFSRGRVCTLLTCRHPDIRELRALLLYLHLTGS